jgi:hypothetical protein
MPFLSTQIATTHTTEIQGRAIFETHQNNNVVVVRVSIIAGQNSSQQNDFVLDTIVQERSVNLIEGILLLSGTLTFDDVSNAVKFQGRFVVRDQVFNQLDMVVAAI